MLYPVRVFLNSFDTFSKCHFLFKVHRKIGEVTNTQQVFGQCRLPKGLFTHNRQPFASETFISYLTTQHAQHIASFPLYPQSNELTKNIRKIKGVLTKAKTAKNNGNPPFTSVLQPNRSCMPSLKELLHNRTKSVPFSHLARRQKCP